MDILTKTLLEFDDKTVRNLLENVYTKEERYHLMYKASSQEDIKMLEKLIQCGMDVNEEKEFDYGYMYVAIREGKFRSAKCLIDAGITCFEEVVYAVQCGRPDVLEYMLEKNWDINTKKEYSFQQDIIDMLIRNKHKTIIPVLDRYKERFTKKNKERYKKARLELLF